MKFFLRKQKKNNVAIIVRVPLASGLLTGKMNLNSSFPNNDHRNYNINGDSFDVGETFSGINFQKGIEAVKELKKLLPLDFSLTDLALKWILSHHEVTVVIPGAKNKLQAQLNTRASEMNNINTIMNSISDIYKSYFKDDVHSRW